MSNRESDVANRVPGTCEWVRTQDSYANWMSTGGLLWVNGKPGAGKSTVMRFVQDDLRNREADRVLTHFFDARNNGLQRTRTGLLRKLVYQLVVLLSDLALAKFIERCYDRCVLEDSIIANLDWKADLLEKDLEYLLDIDFREYRTYLLIDALDECSHPQHLLKIISSYLNSLCHRQPRGKARLFIAVSCRPWPEVITTYDYQITVDDSNSDDIAKAARFWLGTGHVDVSSHHKDFLAGVIGARAAGIMHWVRLVTSKVTEDEAADEEDESSLVQLIDSVPTELTKLYTDLLRTIRDEDADHTLLIMQLMCYASRPLTVNEMCTAYFLGAQNIAEQNGRTSPIKQLSPDIMRKRLLRLSRGLIEVSSNDGQGTIQFIHLAVRDHMRRDGLRELYHWQCQRRGVGQTGNIFVISHHQIFKICAQYLNSDEIVRFAERNEITPAMLGSFPFLDYVLHSWPHHFPVQYSEDCDKALDTLSHRLVKNYVRLRGLRARQEAINDVHGRAYTGEWDLVSILASNNAPGLVEALLKTKSSQGNPQG